MNIYIYIYIHIRILYIYIYIYTYVYIYACRRVQMHPLLHRVRPTMPGRGLACSQLVPKSVPRPRTSPGSVLDAFGPWVTVKDGRSCCGSELSLFWNKRFPHGAGFLRLISFTPKTITQLWWASLQHTGASGGAKLSRPQEAANLTEEIKKLKGQQFGEGGWQQNLIVRYCKCFQLLPLYLPTCPLKRICARTTKETVSCKERKIERVRHLLNKACVRAFSDPLGLNLVSVNQRSSTAAGVRKSWTSSAHVIYFIILSIFEWCKPMACQLLPGFSLLNWSTRRALGQHSSKGSAKRIQGAAAVGIGEPNTEGLMYPFFPLFTYIYICDKNATKKMGKRHGIQLYDKSDVTSKTWGFSEAPSEIRIDPKRLHEPYRPW